MGEDVTLKGGAARLYNLHGQRVLAFGHSLFDLGPVSIPMSKGEVLMTLASTYAPNKLANATELLRAAMHWNENPPGK